MMNVVLTTEARAQILELPLVIQRRLDDVVERLKCWPNVSEAKPLRKNLKGHYRIRTGDYRVVFKLNADRIVIIAADNRKDVYEE